VHDYDGAADYPVARRSFLAGGLGAVAGLVLGRSDAGARASGPRRVSLTFRQRHHLDGCDYVVERVDGETRDERLAAFLGDAKEHAGTEAALLGVLRRATCAEVTDHRRLAALERRLATATTDHYRKRTGRAAGSLILTLVLGRYRVPVPGGIGAPSPPVPPPTPPPRP
jgi:hypothetical protein